MPRCCAFRTNSSTSPNWYAGSKGSVACGGTRRRHLRPVDDRPQDRRVVRARPIQSVQARAVPAEHRVVVEADPHAVGCRCGRDEDSGCETREDEQADDETHVDLLGRVRDAGTVARPRKGGVRRRLPLIRPLPATACTAARRRRPRRSRRLGAHGLGDRLHARPAQDPPRVPLHGGLVGDPRRAARRAADGRRARHRHPRRRRSGAPPADAAARRPAGRSAAAAPARRTGPPSRPHASRAEVRS